MSKKSTIINEEIIGKVAENLGGAPAHNKQNVVNGADRNEMIAMAAYYLSESRGFNNGNAMQDWLEAEAQINNTL